MRQFTSYGGITTHCRDDLMLLYSQAVEYYNGMNDEKYTHFESRIQNMLVRPEILMVMANASKNPAKFAKEEEAKAPKEKEAEEK